MDKKSLKNGKIMIKTKLSEIKEYNQSKNKPKLKNLRFIVKAALKT